MMHVTTYRALCKYLSVKKTRNRGRTEIGDRRSNLIASRSRHYDANVVGRWLLAARQRCFKPIRQGGQKTKPIPT